MGVFRTAEEVNVLTVSELMVRFFEVDGEDSRRKIFRRAQNDLVWGLGKENKGN